MGQIGNKFRNIAQLFTIEKAQEACNTKEGGGSLQYKVREV